MMDHLGLAKQLDAIRAQLAARASELALRNPFWEQRFGPGIGERMLLDCDMNLSVLVKSIRYRSPMMLDDHTRWRRNQIIGFGCSSAHIREVYGYMWTAISEQVGPEYLPTIYDYLSSALSSLAYPNRATPAIEAAQEQLAEAATHACYDQFWHWQEAFSAEGRTTVLGEIWMLLAYAVDAIGQSRPELLGRYVRSLRENLVSRGLASVHVQQLLFLLAENANRILDPHAAELLTRVLESAAGHLAPEGEAASALVAAQHQIVSEVASEFLAAGVASRPEEAALEVGWYLSYLSDGVARERAEALTTYTSRHQRRLSARGLGSPALQRSFAALATSLDRHLPQYAAHSARMLLETASYGLR